MVTIHRCAQCGAVLEKKIYGYACVPCFVAESCAAQGIPVQVTDPVVLRDIAVLLKTTPRKSSE